MARALSKTLKAAKTAGGFALLYLISGFNSALLAEDNEVYSQEAVTAAYIYRIVSYVDWQNANAKSQFTIATLGGDGVVDELERVLQNRNIKDVPARVHRIRTPSDVGDAQVLYIGSNYNKDLAHAISSIANKNILIITDHQGALSAGAAINFLLVNRRVRFEISIPNAERAQLKISSALLSVAVHVQDSRQLSKLGCTPSEHDTNNCIEKISNP